jgi:hypothetical protein
MRTIYLFILTGLVWSFTAFLHIEGGFSYPYFYPWQLTSSAVIIGGVLGAASGWAVARFQLGILSKSSEFRLKKHIPYVLFLVGFGFILGGVGAYFLPGMSLQNQDLLLDSVLSMLPAMCFTLVASYSNWERKHKRTILSGLLSGLYATPKQDTNMVSTNDGLKS